MSVREHTRSPWRAAYETLVEALVSRPAGRAEAGAYSESLERDSKGIVKPAVSLRVCEEFPTAEAVQAAVKLRFDELCRAYPLPNGDAWTGEGAMTPFGPAVNDEPIPF